MRQTVLLVARHAGVRTALADRLTQAPEAWDVRIAHTVEEAIGAVQETTPTVILCDPTYLNRDAAAVVRCLSALSVPVVVLAPTLRLGEEQALKQAGARAVLVQELPFAAVRQCLAAAVAAGTAEADPPERAAG